MEMQNDLPTEQPSNHPSNGEVKEGFDGLKRYSIDRLTPTYDNLQYNNDLIKILTNKVLDLVIIEVTRPEMKDVIKNKLVHPLLTVIYLQLYPYLYSFIILIVLMFLMLILILIFFLNYLKK